MTDAQEIAGRAPMCRRWCLPAVALVVQLSVSNAASPSHVAPHRTDPPAAMPNHDSTSGPTAPDKKPPKSNGKEKGAEGKRRSSESRATKGRTARLDELRKLQLTYETEMAVAAAFEAVNEKGKAIDSYEKAILAAPDDEKKAAAMNALKAIVGVEDNSWLKPTVEKLQSLWFWVAVVLALFILSIPLLLLRRLLRWINNKCRNEQRFRVVVTPCRRSAESDHFRNLIQQAHDALQTQRMLIQRIGKRSVVSIISSFRSNSLVAMLPINLPTVLAKRWWAPAFTFLNEWLDPPDYLVTMSVMSCKSCYGVYVRLKAKCGKTRDWRRECQEAELPVVMADLAFEVIANINHRQRTGNYVY